MASRTIAANTGWGNLGINHDTAAVAVENIRCWWHELGAARYPAASIGLIVCALLLIAVTLRR